MTAERSTHIPEILRKHESTLLADWIREQQEAIGRRRDLISDRELEAQSREFLGLFRSAAQQGGRDDVATGAGWGPVREMLSGVSRTRSLQGFSPSETAIFVFSLKEPLFQRIRDELGKDTATLFEEIRRANDLLDRLGLYTTEVYQKSREEVIHRQQQDMLELSTPVVKLWDGILALPMIGTLDSARTQVVMENLLQRIVDTGAEVAILDITGVPTVDTLTAQHLHQDGHRRAAHGRRLHHQRHPPADRADHRPPGGRPGRRDHQGDPGGRVLGGAQADEPRRRPRRGAAGLAETAVDRIPILKMGDLLLVTIQVDMHDQLALTLQDDLTDRISRTGAKGVLIDISSLEVVDSFIGRMLANIAAMARVLDAATVVVGMQPAVAITLVELGLSLPGVRTALNVERGMTLLRGAVEEDHVLEVGDDRRTD